VDLINKPNLGFSEGIPWIAKNVGLVVASQSDPFGKSLYLLGITRSPTYHEVIPLEKVGAIKLTQIRYGGMPLRMES